MHAGVRVEEKDLASVITNYLREESNITNMASAALELGKPGAAYDTVNYLSLAVIDDKVI
jgi:UDP-N-acetylglucosamine:LPS N-acetylglucosamine transferase